MDLGTSAFECRSTMAARSGYCIICRPKAAAYPVRVTKAGGQQPIKQSLVRNYRGRSHRRRATNRRPIQRLSRSFAPTVVYWLRPLSRSASARVHRLKSSRVSVKGD